MGYTPLPDGGVRYDMATRERRRLSVVAHLDGSRTLQVYDTDDIGADALSLRLAADEAAVLMDAVMPARHSPGLLATAELGLVAERIALPEDSQWDGRPLGDTRMRTETGVSVVAVLRLAEAVPSPGPDYLLAGGDTLIVIGTREGVGAAGEILGR
ncbi:MULTISPECIES: cation:proton antiporter regulatory subunit [unclassified Streptomyces]|uniref:cation:proton antiporter regulatory subunit n=1 Tax=unclassified Streptomyces TaxID=2593676 RepID=UPI000F6CDBF6|nr:MULTISPECIES: TrkA C-terminal domain-containing protein [unclassified Streptomyces]AZM60986.1 potassium transporter TrkA [Streptomyces sp. WAC 01438]RSM97726.1 potassium transporter TrkA [Streptomyces sp. WAC 01420]